MCEKGRGWGLCMKMGELCSTLDRQKMTIFLREVPWQYPPAKSLVAALRTPSCLIHFASVLQSCLVPAASRAILKGVQLPFPNPFDYPVREGEHRSTYRISLWTWSLPQISQSHWSLTDKTQMHRSISMSFGIGLECRQPFSKTALLSTINRWFVAFPPSSFRFFCTNLDQAWLIVGGWQIDYSTGMDVWVRREVNTSLHQRTEILTCKYRSRLARDWVWLSRASWLDFSSYRLQLYQDVPCSDHGPNTKKVQTIGTITNKMSIYYYLPMHTQQNSYLHFRHVMWLHPPFFSMVEWHLGHSLVWADIQFAVSESSSHFFCHFLTSGQIAG